MKKQLAGIAIFALVLLSSSGFSQISVQPGVVIGLGAFKETESDPTGSYSTNTNNGFLAGGVLDIAFNKYLSLEPGIEYSGRGGSTFYTITDSLGYPLGSESVIDKLSYLAIPINLRVKIPVSPSFSLYELAGINLVYLLSATETDSYSGITTQVDIKSQMHLVDFGVDIGAGVEFNVGTMIPFFEMDYLFGLTNTDANPDDAINSISEYNNGLEIRAGIRFKT